jgi:hypothetical protein
MRGFEKGMSTAATINRDVVEGLYSRALLLSDEVASAFDEARRNSAPTGVRAFALVTEQVRTTMLLGHATRWLLDCRACIWSDLPFTPTRRNAPLVTAFSSADGEWLALLPNDLGNLVREVERFCLQLIRLEQAFQQPDAHVRAEESAGSNVVYLRNGTAAALQAPAAKTA